MTNSTRPRALLMVHAHPDDEALATGGTLARYSAEGARTVLVTCTRGEAGEISDPSLATPENVGEVRERELAEAVEALGIVRFVQLGYRDSGMIGTPDNDHPASLNRADLEEVTLRLVQLIREERPEVVVTYDEHGGYGHPDHIRAHEATVAAVERAGDPAYHPEEGAPFAPSRLYYTAFPRSRMMRFFEAMRAAGGELPAVADREGQPAVPGVPDELISADVDVTAYLDRKLAAILAHRTQTGPGTRFSAVPEEFARQFWSKEAYVIARGEANGRQADLFEGLG
jgi:N-acetyl-1-D-myo-inositol-2-amino-2-deoxy-alpha-D-glucopyranoside deacetylase